MQLSFPFFLALGSGFTVAQQGEGHGEGVEGTVQGPVAFLWPENRPWSAAKDNMGPCGSSNGVGNRTSFPLSQGSVALTIADEAWNVAFSIAYANDPTNQDQFVQRVAGVPAVESGHQCYKIADIPQTIQAHSNATIQLEYWSNMDNELGGRNQSFFACADITFVEPADFSTQVPCFNVTASDFNQTAPKPDDTGADDTSSLAPSGGLSTAAIAGITVGAVVASLLVVGVVAWLAFRKKDAKSTDTEDRAYPKREAAEVASMDSHH
ncbi:hypothetical protein F4777DRAFT_164269 [Nemania sp. FL0916]|nr:hypothetical protein F4777DRAFT_164269 [Nemania sp. FL0916]